MKAVSDSTPEKERRPEIKVSNDQCVNCTGDHSLFAHSDSKYNYMK